jgi:hypothetical protein
MPCASMKWRNGRDVIPDAITCHHAATIDLFPSSTIHLSDAPRTTCATHQRALPSSTAPAARHARPRHRWTPIPPSVKGRSAWSPDPRCQVFFRLEKLNFCHGRSRLATMAITSLAFRTVRPDVRLTCETNVRLFVNCSAEYWSLFGSLLVRRPADERAPSPLRGQRCSFGSLDALRVEQAGMQKRRTTIMRQRAIGSRVQRQSVWHQAFLCRLPSSVLPCGLPPCP